MPDDNHPQILNVAATLLPVERDWVATLNSYDGTVRAFDLLTLDPIFEGPFIPPERYSNLDPRRWSDELMGQLLDQYGPHGGTLHQEVIFVLAEAQLTRILRNGLTEPLRKQFDRLPLRDALEQGRGLWTDWWHAQMEGSRHA